MGVLLYRKMGFEEVGRLEMELERFGGEGRHVHGELSCCWERELMRLMHRCSCYD